MASCIEASFTNVAALVNAEKHFSPRTPKRWNLIVQKLSAASNKCSGASETVESDGSNYGSKLLSSSYIEFSRRLAVFSDPSVSAFKPLILLPTVQSCCAHHKVNTYRKLLPCA